MNPAWFSGSHPKPTVEGFMNVYKKKIKKKGGMKLVNKLGPNLFRTSAGLLLVYLIFKLMYKKN